MRQRLGESCRVPDGLRFEHHHVRCAAWNNAASVVEPESISGKRSHLANGLFQADNLVLANILGQHSGKSAERAGVSALHRSWIDRLGIAIDHDEGGPEGLVLLLLVHARG